MYKRSRKSVRFREVSVKRKFTVYNFHRLFALLNGETLKLSSKIAVLTSVQEVYRLKNGKGRELYLLASFHLQKLRIP